MFVCLFRRESYVTYVSESDMEKKRKKGINSQLSMYSIPGEVKKNTKGTKL